MTLSMNEIEAIAKKRPRVGSVSATLTVAQHWPKCWNDWMVSQLPDFRRPRETVAGMRKAICSVRISAEAAFSDLALKCGDRVNRWQNVLRPILRMPFIAAFSRFTERHVTLNCEGTRVTTNAGAFVSATLPDMAAVVTVTPAATFGEPGACRLRVSPSADTWNALRNFARRTYVPATEESRAKGAGGGLSDSD